MEEIHPLFDSIRQKILDLIDKKVSEGLTLEKIGDLCGLTKVHISTLRSGKRGKNFSLNAALKIWEGLGNSPETLIADCNVDPLLAVKIKNIQKSEYWPLFVLLVETLKDYEYADPGQLSMLEACLKIARDTIIFRKDQQAEPPGERLSGL